MNKRKCFGLSKELERGISETINTTRNNVGQLRYEIIPLSRVILDPTNPRELSVSLEDIKNGIADKSPESLGAKQKEELEKLQSLATSIKKVGVRHAIEVYKDGHDYKVISGERRVLASYLAKKVDIQARILEHKPTALDLKLLQWIENIERADLNLWERINNMIQLASAYEKQHKERLTAQKLSDILGCSRQHSTNLLTVVNASEFVLRSLQNGKINNLEKAAFVARVNDEDLRQTLLEACASGASLESLKEISDLKGKKENKRVGKKKGRAQAYINLGRTNNVFAIKRLMEAVLSTDKYAKYSSRFNNLDWSKVNVVNNAFKLLLKIINDNETGK